MAGRKAPAGSHRGNHHDLARGYACDGRPRQAAGQVAVLVRDRRAGQQVGELGRITRAVLLRAATYWAPVLAGRSKRDYLPSTSTDQFLTRMVCDVTRKHRPSMGQKIQAKKSIADRGEWGSAVAEAGRDDRADVSVALGTPSRAEAVGDTSVGYRRAQRALRRVVGASTSRRVTKTNRWARASRIVAYSLVHSDVAT